MEAVGVTVSYAHVLGWVESFSSTVAENREYLTRLDSAIGDADHGINMDRGMTAVREHLPTLRDGQAGALFKQVGRTLISTVGGASGPLYGTFFLRLGTALGEAEDVSPADVARGLRAGLDGIIGLGKANLDDKTMVDAMTPAVEALEAGAEADFATALAAAAAAAAAGRDRITPLVARKGRASYLCPRSEGHQDPGATSSYLLLRSAAEALGS
jgi:phosphoenolpyruvate---glycerone phosphotransferase subunit DhaL